MSKAKDEIDILVGIPTLNEEDSIKNVVEKVDLGLCKYFPSYKALIMNTDSDSQDKTRLVFRKTATKTPKLTVKEGGRVKGKGANIYSFLKYAIKKKAKYICTVDGDLYSIEPSWIKRLISPLIDRKADFVTPLYTRNRYEGNTTNHFCVPFLKYAFAKEIRQPIGGEYAYSSKFAKYILAEPKPAYSYKYGIDMFLSGHAVGAGFNISEVWLGRKMHKPSFGKMLAIFQHEAGAAYYILNRYREVKNSSSRVNSAKKRLAIDSYFKKPEENSIKERGEIAVKLFNEVIDNRSYRGLSKDIISDIRNGGYRVDSTLWVKILQELFEYTRSKGGLTEKENERLARLSLPLYLFRVLTYFQEIEDKPTGFVEKLLDYNFD